MKILFLGDPHIKPSTIEESERLLEFVLAQAKANSVDQIVILGDLFHTHAIIRVEVQIFWNKWLQKLSQSYATIVLCGNHDLKNHHETKDSALTVLKHIENSRLYIVDTPLCMGDFLFTPYIHKESDFLEVVEKNSSPDTKVLVCHQTFDGAKYDNGFYAPDGFDSDTVNVPLIISGHIHSRDRFGKVIYPGTASWQSVSDVNKEKGIWIAEFYLGKIANEKFIDTSTVVTPIFELSWKEGEEMPVIPPGRVTVELIGTSAWIDMKKPLLAGKASFRSKITDRIQARARKTGSSFEDFVKNVFQSPLQKDQLLRKMKELDLVSSN